MIRLRQPADAALLADLKDAGLLTPDILEGMEAAAGRPEEATLNEYLLAGAERVSEEAWLAWLIRRHGCHRYGRVSWRAEAQAWARSGLPPEGNLPCRACADGRHALLAVMRPDRIAASERRYPGLIWLRAAATLPEMRDLHSAWMRR
ncbi:MAG TPA: hypothetical protein VHV47_01345 [Opitutaceae bacterium]|jgi:hypothetical protein|nr:hypothetical protein [Opitutaceae bacterium]